MLTTLDPADPRSVPAEPSPAAAPSRRVVVLLASATTQLSLTTWATAHGFDLNTDFDGNPRDPGEHRFHLTLFATAGNSALPLGDVRIAPVVATPTGFDVLGRASDTPVITCDVDRAAHDLRAVWLAASLADPTFWDWLPHVSLSYDWTGTPALEDLPMYALPMTFDRLSVRELEPADAPGDEDGIPVSAYTRADGTEVTAHRRGKDADGDIDIKRASDPEIRRQDYIAMVERMADGLPPEDAMTSEAIEALMSAADDELDDVFARWVAFYDRMSSDAANDPMPAD